MPAAGSITSSVVVSRLDDVELRWPPVVTVHVPRLQDMGDRMLGVMGGGMHISTP